MQERLRDKIRNEIAQEKLQANLAKIQALLSDYRQVWVQYDAESKSKPDAKKPAPPDFAALAKTYNMDAGRTGLVSNFELYDLDLGKSETHQQHEAVVQLMFGPTTLYKPEISDYSHPYPDMKRTSYVLWKTDDQPDHIPKWEDSGVRGEVLRVWKLNEARKLADKRAEELKAEAAAHSGKSFKELPSAGKKDFKVVIPPDFSSVTQIFGRVQPPEVSGLDKISDDFMKKVFNLAPNQVETSANRPKTEIYVVRAIEFTPFDELWSDFTANAENWSLYTAKLREQIAGMILMIGDEQREVSQAWWQKVKADAGLKEVRPTGQGSTPDQGGTPDQGPSPGDEE